MKLDKVTFNGGVNTEGKTFAYFNLMYVIALSAIAVVAVVAQVIIQSYSSQGLAQNHITNVAGRQRMLSQKLSKIALQVQAGDTSESLLAELDSAVVLWRTSHTALIQGNEAFEIPRLKDELLIQRFDSLTPYYNQMLKGGESLVFLLENQKTQSYKTSVFVGMILDNEDEYLRHMNDIVDQMDRGGKERIQFIRALELGFLCILIVTLLLEIAFIFNPVSKKIKSVISSLIASESNAMQLADEMKELNISLKKTDKDFRDINFALDKATVLIKTDKEGIIKYVNDRYCKTTKYTQDELVGRPLFFNNQGGEESIIYEHIRNSEVNKNLWQGEVYDHAKDGSSFWVDVTLIPIISMEGDLYQFLVICNDITKRKQAEKRLQLVTEQKFNQQISEQKDRSYSVIQGQEQERKRMAREVHDGVGQMLTALKFNTEALNPTDDKQGKQFQNIKDLLQSVIREVRRISSDLLPTVLSDFGLIAALRDMESTFNNSDNPIKLEFEDDVDLEGRLDRTIEISLYRIAQEAVNNALKYSQGSLIRVVLNSDVEFLNLTILDDGVGFVPEEAIESNRNKSTGNGLTSMRERAELINGEFSIESTLGEGTRVIVEVPLEKESYE